MRRYIDNRPEIGDTLTLRPLIHKLKKLYPNDEITVREDPHGLLADLDISFSAHCCVVCGETIHSSVEGTPYSRCTDCGFWYQCPPPVPRQEMRAVEDRGHLMSQSDKGVNNAIAQYLWKKYSPRSVLDIGSKYPYLLHCLKRAGVEHVQGVDFCNNAVEYGHQLKVPMVCGDFLQYAPGRKYEMITMIHLIEHFIDPRRLVRKAKRLLADGGTLIVRTPYVADDLAASLVLRGGDASRDMTEQHYEIHPVLFSEHALVSLLEQEGFEITHTVRLAVGQIDIEAKLVADTEFNPILRQWTNKHEHGDYLRRSRHFYQFPFAMAHELGWLESSEYEQPGLPILPDPRPLKLPERYVVITTECGGVARRWPIDRWKRLISWLLSRGIEVVTIGKTPFAFPGTHELSGCLKVIESAAVIKNANLVISADTMAAHLGGLLGVPTIALMGPAEAKLTFADNVRAVYRADDGCTRCYSKLIDDKPYVEGQQPPIHHSCDYANSQCMAHITVGQAITAVADTLGIVQRNDGLLTVCMMVKNEDHNVGAALASVIRAADEFIIVDTGSTDGTKATVERVLEGKKYRLLDYDPGDPIRSFSEVRNFAFQNATSKYVMWLDAGDRVTDARKLRKVVQAGLADSYSLQTLYGNLHYWRERVVLRQFAEFVDDVHETMRIDGLTSMQVTDVSVRHHWTEKKNREPSLERNTRLLKGMIDRDGAKENARYSRWVYYYARDLLQLNRHDEALKQFERRVTLGGFWEERALAAIQVAKIHMEKDRHTDAIRAAYDAMKLCDGWRDPYYIVGDAYFWIGNYEMAISWFEHCLKIPKPRTLLGVWADIYEWLPQCQLSYCYERLGKKAEALKWAQEEQKYAPSGQAERIKQRILSLAK